MDVRYGSLFSGGLGLDMAVHMLWPDAEPAWVCENDPHAARLIAHHLPDAPNLGDITAVGWSQVEPVDLLVGGFPCQDISTAGKRAGIKEGTRSGLWFRFADAIRELRPRLVPLENVAALTSAGGGLDVVLGSLAELGFDAEWGVLRASDVGAPHGRARWFCVAYPVGEASADPERVGGERRGGDRDVAGPPRAGEADGEQRQRDGDAASHRRPTAADPDVARLEGRESARGRDVPAGRDSWGDYWPAIERWQRTLGRPAPAPADDRGRLNPAFVEWMMGWPQGWVDLLSRTQALKVLGNGVVPLQAAVAFSQLLERAALREVAA